MKKILGIIILLLVTGTIMAQNGIPVNYLLDTKAVLNQANKEFKSTPVVQSTTSDIGTRAFTTARWYNFISSLDEYLGTGTGSMYYDQYFPDSVNVIYKDPNNPGQYLLNRTRNLNIGMTFTPNDPSDVMDNDTNISRPLGTTQTYQVDSVAFVFDYERFLETYNRLVTKWDSFYTHTYKYTYTLKTYKDSFIITSKTGNPSTFLPNDKFAIIFHLQADTMILESKTGSKDSIMSGDNMVMKDKLGLFNDTLTVLSKTGVPDSVKANNKIVFKYSYEQKDSTINPKDSVYSSRTSVQVKVPTPVVDTMNVYVFKGNTQVFNITGGTTKEGATVEWDSIRKAPKYYSSGTAGYTQKFQYTLTSADTAGAERGKTHFKAIKLNNFVLTGGGVAAITWEFRPGYTWSINDTLNGEATLPNLTGKKMNQFYYVYYNDPTFAQIDESNNGVWIYAWPIPNMPPYLRVNFGSGNLRACYWTNQMFTHPKNYPYVMWKIIYDPTKLPGVGIKENYGVSMSQLYPNPANDYTNIKFNLLKTEMITVELYNSIGQKIITLAKGNYSAGEQNIVLNLKGIQKGFYICKITAGDNVSTSNLIIE